MDKLSLNIEKIDWEIRRERLIELGSVYRARIEGYNYEILEYDWWDELHDEDLNRVFSLAETEPEKITGMFLLYRFITWGDPHDETNGLDDRYGHISFMVNEHTFNCLYLWGGFVDQNLNKQKGFTDIQKQVFQLILLEYTEEEIGSRLKITQQGVNKHKKLIQNKINKCWSDYQKSFNPKTKRMRYIKKHSPGYSKWKKRKADKTLTPNR